MKLKNCKGFFLSIFFLNFNIATFALENSKDKLLTNESFDSEVLNLQNNLYLLGPGDVINLQLFGAPEFSNEYKILNDGTVTFPLIGNTMLNNLTIKQATDLLTNLYAKELLRNDLFINVVIERPIRVSLIGELQRPGLYSLTSNESNQILGGSIVRSSGLPRVVDAIQKAGGITQDANLKKVYLLRRLPGQEMKYKKAELDLAKLVFEGSQNQNPFLFDGDVIKIEKAKNFNNKIIDLTQTNLSPKTISVSIIGEVENPGRYDLMANTTLNQAILQAGGPKFWKANKKNVQLLRINRNGSLTRRKFKINLNEGLSSKTNPALKNFDVISINKSAFAKVGSGINVISEPMIGIVSGVTLLKLLND